MEQFNTPKAIDEGVWTVLKVPSKMPEQNDVYYLFYKIIIYLFYKIIIYLFYKMMFYNMILIMTGHYPNYVLGKMNAWSRVRFQPFD